MDDMVSALGSILNNPGTMQQIMNIASQLGLNGDAPQAAPAAAPAAPQAPPVPQQPVAPTQPYAVPPQGAAVPQPVYPPPAQTAAPNLFGNIDINTISRLSQAMATMNQRDQNVDLLLALKPHFSEKRQKKVDDAIRIMQLVKVLPLLKETGLFGNLFGGDG